MENKKSIEMSKLKKLRTLSGVSVSEFSGILSDEQSIGAGNLRKYEERERSIDGAKLETLLTIANGLHCRIEDIVEDENTVKKIKAYQSVIYKKLQSNRNPNAYIEYSFDARTFFGYTVYKNGEPVCKEINLDVNERVKREVESYIDGSETKYKIYLRVYGDDGERSEFTLTKEQYEEVFDLYKKSQEIRLKNLLSGVCQFMCGGYYPDLWLLKQTGMIDRDAISVTKHDIENIDLVQLNQRYNEYVAKTKKEKDLLLSIGEKVSPKSTPVTLVKLKNRWSNSTINISRYFFGCSLEFIQQATLVINRIIMSNREGTDYLLYYTHSEYSDKENQIIFDDCVDKNFRLPTERYVLPPLDLDFKVFKVHNTEMFPVGSVGRCDFTSYFRECDNPKDVKEIVEIINELSMNESRIFPKGMLLIPLLMNMGSDSAKFHIKKLYEEYGLPKEKVETDRCVDKVLKMLPY